MATRPITRAGSEIADAASSGGGSVLGNIARRLGARVKNVGRGGSRFIRNIPARLWSIITVGFGGVVGTLVGLAVLTFAVKTLL